MKNTTKTNKYAIAFSAALFALVFLVAKPVSVFAQSADWSTDSGNSQSVDWSTGGNSQSVDWSSDYPTQYYTQYTSGTYSYPAETTYGYDNPYYVGSTITGGNSIVVTQPINTYTGTSYIVSPTTTGGTTYYTGTTYTNGSSYPMLEGSCSASVANAAINYPIVWTANVSGGNGSYTYHWTGDDGFSSAGESVSQDYTYAGVKDATVTITSSDGQTISRTCSVNIGSQNQVLAYSDTVTPLSQVSLNEVPYTGAGDIARVVSFILGLIAWSALLAYFFMKKKYGINIFAPHAQQEMQVAEASVSNEFIGTITSDTKDLSFVEEYARMKKVILSSDASVKLVKLQRLGKGSAVEIIDTLSGNEWTAVGENDIESALK